ncbi:hypothetical protein TWF730_009071 [Orbilia blumenaviensis]|uniref:Peptidase S8/S53 domain-containing protein n=1 Tax=Orbilia blumenaviensis TaxID=1796055 RepID=A0AAV9UZK3_9PEZI
MAEAPERLSYYPTILLKAFHQHWKKFRLQRHDYHRDVKRGGQRLNRAAHRLQDCRQAFENDFVTMISNEISPGKEGLLLAAGEPLPKLFTLLDRLVNPKFDPTDYAPVQNPQINPARWCLHRNLERVLSLLSRFDGLFDLSSGTRHSVFTISSLEDGIAARLAIKNVLCMLDSIQVQSIDQTLRPSPTTRFPRNLVLEPHPADKFLEFFDDEYRPFVARILGTTLSEFRKCPSAFDHKIMIQLPQLGKGGRLSSVPLNQEMVLDGIIYCPNLLKWHIVHCKFDDVFESSDQLCEVAKIALDQGEVSVLLFHESICRFSEDPSASFHPKIDPNAYPLRSLKALIKVDELFNMPNARCKNQCTFNHSQRRELAVKLLLHILAFISTDSMPDSFDGDQVSFLSKSGSSENCNREEPYFSCRAGCRTNNIAATSFEEADTETQMVRAFAELAKLLMEIEYGPIDEQDRTGPESDSLAAVRDFYKRQKIHNDFSKENYLKAVRNCLEFERVFKSERARKAGRFETVEDTRKRIIRTEIIRNVLVDLPAFQQPLPKRRRALDSDTRIPFPDRHRFQEPDAIDSDSDSDEGTIFNRYNKSQQRLLSARTGIKPVTLVVSTPSVAANTAPKRASVSKIPRLGASKIPSERKKVSFSDLGPPKTNPGCLFDLESTPVSIPPQTAVATNTWLEALKENTFPIINRLRREGDKPRVKVAVIDTGLDKENSRIKKHLEENFSEVVGCLDLIGSSENVEDEIGHGTAVCDILLQIAKVDLYVAKVSNTPQFDSSAPSRVAKAITHASSAGGWNVDIIVLSLGFDDEDDSIRQAILNAHSKDKIIFAAASNSGSLMPEKLVSYPARIQGHVISIRSATGQSQKSPASPRASYGDDNFMVVGEGIKAAWPQNLNDGSPARYVSGSSFATPVAAGIAALVLEFSIQRGPKGRNISDENRQRLWTHRGIRGVFHSMATVDSQAGSNGCRMICPWKLFARNRGDEGCKIELNLLMQNL